ncbi:DUF6644 family protein [Phenylobacterium sp.]|uniref:DUF6644 family protein n=1 Tax=Phenylobacterium sp. TaxID=1871053 RepID=UPI002811E8EB|nr:DUF6644 family protein [Phenylobacterium sp.]
MFPTLETAHVVALSLVVGSIAMLDLRLLGLGWRTHPVDRLARQILPWTWWAFSAAIVTGALMFVSNATLYGVNLAFQLKFALIALAGFNMIYFHKTAFARVAEWGGALPTPPAARIAGAASLVFWASVVAAGRWIGFTL